jgi:hypothetical protein
MRVVVERCSSTYCHAITSKGDHIFVHQQESDFDLRSVHIGDVLEIEYEQSSRGFRATTASWVERPELPEASDEAFEGFVVHIDDERKFCFVRPADKFVPGIYRRSPFDVMAHISGAADYDGESPMFNRLSRGLKVSGVVRQTARGMRLQFWSLI